MTGGDIVPGTDDQEALKTKPAEPVQLMLSRVRRVSFFDWRDLKDFKFLSDIPDIGVEFFDRDARDVN